MRASEPRAQDAASGTTEVVSLIQDPRNRGGIETVVGWYRRWMDSHRPNDYAEVYLDDVARSLNPFAGRSWKEGEAFPRFLPRLHFPQFYAGRAVIRSRVRAREGHVIGAVALQGYLVPDIPLVTWIGTTIGDERRNVIDVTDRLRSAYFKLTLPFLERMERDVLLRSQRVLAQSPHTADRIVALGIDADRVELRPVPVDTEHFHPGPGERKGVLFVGRTSDVRKRFEIAARLVAASDRIRREGLDVVSPDPRPSDLGEAVRWHGEVDDIAPFFRRAAVFVLTSIQEGLGIVVFEAMASGTPVVALASGGPDRWIRDSGGGVVVDEPASLQAAVEKFLVDRDEAREKGAQGRTWVEAKMSARDFLADDSVFRL